MLDKYKYTKEDTIVVLVDFQEKLMPAMFQSEEVIENTAKLVQGANALDLPIIYTEQYPKGLGATVEKIKIHFSGNCNYMDKTIFSAYEPIRELLEKYGRKNVIISGCEAHVCLYQTVRDLLNNSYNPIVISDCSSSRTQFNRMNAFESMRDMGAIITNYETILFDMLIQAKGDSFKTISKIVK